MKTIKRPAFTTGQCIRYMLSLGWKYQKIVFLYVIGGAIVEVGLNTVRLCIAPQILAKVEQAAPLHSLIQTIVLFALSLFLLSTFREYVKDSGICNRLVLRQKIVIDMTRKYCETSYPNTEQEKFRQLFEGAAVATSSNSDGTEHIWITLSELLQNILGFAVYLFLIANLNAVLSIVVILTSVASYFISKKINEWGYRHRDERHQHWERMNYIRKKAESGELAKDIRIFGLGEWIRDIYNVNLSLFEAFVRKRESVYIWANIIDVVFTILRNGLAYWYLISAALRGSMSASEFLLYFTALSGFTAWVTGILSSCSQLHKECLEISTVLEYLNYPEPFRFAGGRAIPNAESYELRLENVSFRYPGASENLFDHLNLTVHAGEKLAIVGLNGAGKTSLVKLLCGLYDPDEGRVLLNGVDIRDFNRPEYYQLFSAVFQNYSVLDATVLDNLTLDGEDSSSLTIDDCIEKAGLSQFVLQLPQGLQTHMGHDVYLDGVLFSGGQTQRLMLARALHKNGPILILDEPTAALDPIAEDDIYRKYNSMTDQKTAVFISHRLASTRFCDRIIFLADGAVAEEGTHQELMKRQGAYSSLYEVQSRYYQEGSDFRG